MQRLIAHIDMDCFFVSCERKQDTTLNHQPVVVGGIHRRGVVCSASYEARPWGITAGMPIQQAKNRCSKLRIVPLHPELYQRYSRKIYVLLKYWAPKVEYASIDEFYLDLSGCEQMYQQSPQELSKQIQQSIWNRTGLSCSVAMASNKYVAKIAVKTVKPQGIQYVPDGEESRFLSKLPIARLHGAGPQTLSIFQKMNIKLIGDLLPWSLRQLQGHFGKLRGQWIYESVRGIDHSEVQEKFVRKSISCETTFEEDIFERNDIDSHLSWLCERTCYQLRVQRFKTESVSLKVRFSDFETMIRSKKIDATDSEERIFKSLQWIYQSISFRKKIRLLGVQLKDLIRPTQESFPDLEEIQHNNLHPYIDQIKKKYGFSKIMRLSSLTHFDKKEGRNNTTHEH